MFPGYSGSKKIVMFVGDILWKRSKKRVFIVTEIYGTRGKSSGEILNCTVKNAWKEIPFQALFSGSKSHEIEPYMVSCSFQSSKSYYII